MWGKHMAAFRLGQARGILVTSDGSTAELEAEGRKETKEWLATATVQVRNNEASGDMEWTAPFPPRPAAFPGEPRPHPSPSTHTSAATELSAKVEMSSSCTDWYDDSHYQHVTLEDLKCG